MGRNLDDLVLALHEAQSASFVRDHLEIKVGSITAFIRRVEEITPMIEAKPKDAIIPKFMGIEVSEHPLLQERNGVLMKNGMPVGFFSL
jgi:hypothetical protein